jgi:hypothetical protein
VRARLLGGSHKRLPRVHALQLVDRTLQCRVRLLRDRAADRGCGSGGNGSHPAGCLVDILDRDLLAGDTLTERGGHERIERAIEHIAGRGADNAGP